MRLALDEEPRTWGAVVYAWTPRGFGSVDVASALGGAPLIVEGAAPRRLRAGEPVTLDLIVTNVAEAPVRLDVQASGDGVEVSAPGSLALPRRRGGGLRAAARAGRAGSRARGALAAGRGRRARARVADARRERRSSPAPARRGPRARAPLRHRAHRPAGRAARRGARRGARALGARERSGSRRPAPSRSGARRVVGRAGGSPAAPHGGRAAAPRAAARGHDERRRAVALERVRGRRLGERGEHDAEARAALARLHAAFAMFDASSMDADERTVRQGAAALAALAAGGVPELSRAQRDADPVLRAAAGARVVLRRTLREHPEEPTLLARAAAALLLSDPRDAYGLAMLERAAAHLADAPDGGATVQPSARMDDPLEALSATLALSIAAHQAGRGELADRLARGGLGREHVALRRGGEAAFWLLAAGAYGVLGRDAPSVTVVVDGEARELDLASGRAVVPLPAGAGGHAVRVDAPEGRSALVRVEAVMERAFAERAGGPLRLELRGDAGDASTLAALELSVRAERELAGAVVDVSLPAGVDADEVLLGALERAGSVRRAEAREPGMVRVWLGPMAAGTEAVVPLPLRFRVRGSLTGLGAVAYPEGDPGAMTVLPPRTLELSAP
ncbi:MAG: hypothetical protein M5U28_20005 [Sandaracinaceae bacterium]|nr:hypothetical protein [Sandaracinaceae bacterium]